MKRDRLTGQLELASPQQRRRMRAVRLLALISLVLRAVPARAQGTTSVRDTLAYTITIVTIRSETAGCTMR